MEYREIALNGPGCAFFICVCMECLEPSLECLYDVVFVGRFLMVVLLLISATDVLWIQMCWVFYSYQTDFSQRKSFALAKIRHQCE